MPLHGILRSLALRFVMGASLNQSMFSEIKPKKTILILWVMTALGCGIVMWLKFVHDIRYFGPVPSLILFLLPGFLAMWLSFFSFDKKHPVRFVMMICGTLSVVAGLLLMVKWP